MGCDILGVIYFLFFMMSILFVLRVSYFYLQKLVKTINDEVYDIVFELDKKGLILLNISLSYILTYLFKII